MGSILHTEKRNNRRTNHAKAVKYLRVVDATYAGEYKVNVRFNDNTKQTVDFGPFLYERPHPQYNKYRDVNLFKTFAIEMGNLVWGMDWDLIFPVEQLHQGVVRL